LPLVVPQSVAPSPLTGRTLLSTGQIILGVRQRRELSGLVPRPRGPARRGSARGAARPGPVGAAAAPLARSVAGAGGARVEAEGVECRRRYHMYVVGCDDRRRARLTQHQIVIAHHHTHTHTETDRQSAGVYRSHAARLCRDDDDAGDTTRTLAAGDMRRPAECSRVGLVGRSDGRTVAATMRR